MTDIPVFLTYRDRRTMLDRCLESLVRVGFRDITIIDNDSEVPLDLHDGMRYKNSACYFAKVVRADNEYRQLAPWALGLVPKDDYYVVTDCDLELSEDCEVGVAEYLRTILRGYPKMRKLGLGIMSDFPEPWPDHYVYSMSMELSVERRYPLYENLPGIIAAPTDTTFALHAPGTPEWPGICGARTTRHHVRHLPWYNETYSDEERTYYRRTGTEWAMSHSASTLVTAPIMVVFKTLPAELAIALNGHDFQLVPVQDDETYYWALHDRWAQGETFINNEHDVIPNEDTYRELASCPHDWCAVPYPYRGNPAAHALGMTKFSGALLKRWPDIMEHVDHLWDDLHPRRHWCRMDSWIWRVLTNQCGEVRHDHETPVRHLGANGPAHGCGA